MCWNSAGAELCWHQRNLSFCVDICSAQPHVTGWSEAVCGGVCSRRFDEPRAAPSTVAETEAGWWRALWDVHGSVASLSQPQCNLQASLWIDVKILFDNKVCSCHFCVDSRPSARWDSWVQTSYCLWALWWQKWVKESFTKSISATLQCWHTWGPWQTGALKRYHFKGDILQTNSSQHVLLFPFPDESGDFWCASETQTESGAINSCWSGNTWPSDLRSASLWDEKSERSQPQVR